MKFSTACGVVCTSFTLTAAFVPQQKSLLPYTRIFAGEGLGKGSQERFTEKSYGDAASAPIKDVIDLESAMSEFFSANEEWMPLFRNFAESSSIPATSFIGDTNVGDFDFHETSSPWRRLEAIPTQEDHREVLANFLDNMQMSLLDIPVDETSEEDEYDLHFIEEGRRLLVCGRFHVIQESKKGSIESYDALFSTCWSELMHLRQENLKDTGSLILVPGTDLADLRRFVDMNLQRPLEWLGVELDFEVASFQMGSPAIRLIHKLSDIPDEIPEGPEE